MGARAWSAGYQKVKAPVDTGAVSPKLTAYEKIDCLLVCDTKLGRDVLRNLLKLIDHLILTQLIT